MKISIGRTFDAGQALQALAKAGVKGMDDFITYMQDLSTQLVNALRGTLTIEENLNSVVKQIQLKQNESQLIQLPDEKKSPKHVFVTKALPFTNPALSFAWQITQSGELEVKATFLGSPTTAVEVTLVILF